MQERSYLHPGRQANIIYDGKVVGYLGEVHPEVADNYGIERASAYVAVMDMPEIIPYATFDRKYTGIAKYPCSYKRYQYGCSERNPCRTD